ncbi:membrane protein [Salmonella enterica subsp. enterica]|uniref:Membrane protein n=1 Tax=Salmonella enterica I TaxID=59201 RepID=A0A3S4GNJ3_SALET|nr:membrane protein [Salmonella enterica subsp. enterica]
MKMIVIADDFTGSNDTGVQLAKKGARTEVMLSASQKPSRRADVLVINTESRADARRSGGICRLCRAFPVV